MEEQEPIGIMIKQINDALMKSANNALREDELTLSQTGLLTLLYAAEDFDLTLKQLEKTLRVSQPTVHGIVRRLQQKALVTVTDDQDNLRVKHVRLTEQGVQQCKKGQRHMREAEAQLSRNLTEAELEVFIRLLTKVRDGLI